MSLWHLLPMFHKPLISVSIIVARITPSYSFPDIPTIRISRMFLGDAQVKTTGKIFC